MFNEVLGGLLDGIVDVPGENKATEGILSECSGCLMELPISLKHSTASSELSERLPLSLKKEASSSLVC